MPERHSKGDDAIYFERDGPCKGSTRHRRCPGRWRSPQRRRVSGPRKAAVQDALTELRREIDGGITKPGSGSYTVRACCEDMLAAGLPGRDLKTVAKNGYMLEPVLAVIGTLRVRDLDVTDVDRALAAVAAARSSSTVAMAHLAITRAQAKDLVLRNVSALTGTPTGRRGRPSRSMTLAQATAVTAAASAARPRMHAYVMLSLCTGARADEVRALRWQHVRRPGAVPPRSASVAVWRSVRARGDTKTRKSRQTLGLLRLAAAALRDHARAGERDLVFVTAAGTCWARVTRAGHSAPSARPRASGRTGRRGNCGTPSSP